MGQHKIICSLDGQEPAYELYGGYADPDARTFPDERDAKQIKYYLDSRARGRRRWDPKRPTYQIVPADE